MATKNIQRCCKYKSQYDWSARKTKLSSEWVIEYLFVSHKKNPDNGGNCQGHGMDRIGSQVKQILTSHVSRSTSHNMGIYKIHQSRVYACLTEVATGTVVREKAQAIHQRGLLLSLLMASAWKTRQTVQ